MTPAQEAILQALLTTAHTDFQRGLNIHAYYKVSNHQTGEDLVQDTFIKTWRYLVKGGKVDTMKAFLYHVLDNLVIDHYRKHKTSSLDVLLESGLEPSAPDERLADVLDGKAAILMIARLPVAYQAIMRMKYVQELTIGEMAIATDQSENTVAVQVHRGLKKLKLLYGNI